MLPVGPVDAYGSPFSSTSGFAGNLHLLPPGVVEPSGFDDFRDANADWTLFCALDAEFLGRGWWQWPESLRDRQPAELAAARRRHAAVIKQEYRAQFGFSCTFDIFKRATNARGILLFGDAPMFLVHHSADVWAHRELFQVATDGHAEAVLGVPPDAFSATGQWWAIPAIAGRRWRPRAGTARSGTGGNAAFRFRHSASIYCGWITFAALPPGGAFPLTRRPRCTASGWRVRAGTRWTCCSRYSAARGWWPRIWA